MFDSYDASHHVLHSILCRISVAFLGLSELTLRLPSLLGGLLYFITAWRLSRRLFGDGWLMFGSVALLSLNPFVLDYLSVSRGYGLAVALCLWSLLLMTRFLGEYSHRAIDEAGRSDIYRIAIGLALSVSANLTLLVPCAGLAAIFLAMLLADGAWSGERARLTRELEMTVDSFIVPGIAVAFVILSLPLTKAGMSHFYVGTTTWTEALESLTTPSLRHHELLWNWPGYSRAVDYLLWVVDSLLVPLVLLMTAWVCLMAFRHAIHQRSFARLERIDQFVSLAGGAMLISVGLVTAGHRVLGMPYPVARTGLYFVPLFTLTAVALWKRFGRPPTAALVVWTPPVLLTVLVVVQFMLQLQTTHYGQWRYDAATKKIIGMIRQRGQAKPPATVRLGVSWVFEPSLEFYRRLYQLNWVEPLTRDGPRGGFDYYVLLPSDASLVEEMGLRVIYRDELSGAVLAEPGGHGKMTGTMKLYRWDRVEKEAMNPSLGRQVIHGEKMTVARIHLRKGCVVPLHHHVNEQLSIVERGKLRFTAGGEETVMSPGDMLMIPGNVPHTVEALEDSVAVDINSPVREDWLRGDDSYLRR